MKIITNLPGKLRLLFSVARSLSILGAVFWLLVLPFNAWIQNRFPDKPKLVVTVGEMALPIGPDVVRLMSDGAKPGALALHSLRGTLQVDLTKSDDVLASALRWAIIPAMIVFTVFSFLLSTALRDLCAKIERGEVFSETNLRLVRNIGWIIIGYSVAAFVVQFTGAIAMGSYFSQHVTFSGIEGAAQFPRGIMVGKWSFSGGPFPGDSGFVTGCVVLMLAEAFRQGLKLKEESDLTV